MNEMASRRDGDMSACGVHADTVPLTELVELHRRGMVSAARRYLTSAHDVEDAVQDAWLAFTMYGDAIDKRSAVGAWLRITTAHAALRIVRRQARVKVFDAVPQALVDPLDATSLEMAQESAAIDLALSNLNEDDRLLIRLLFEDELPYAQISALTGRAVAGVGPTRQRVVQKLRRDPALRHLERAA